MSLDKNFEEIANVSGEHERAVFVGLDSGYAVLKSGRTSGSSKNGYVIRYDKHGKETWTKQISSGVWRNFVEDAIAQPDGSIVYAGRHSSVTGSGAVIRKLNSNGEQEWEFTFEVERPSFCQKIYQKDSSLFIIGKAGAGEEGTDAERGLFLSKHRLRRGYTDWSFLYNTDSTDVATDIAFNGSSVLLLGYSNEDAKVIGNRGMLQKITDGKRDWLMYYGSTYQEELLDIEPTDDNGYLIMGTRTMGKDAVSTFVMKTDSVGVKDWEYVFENSGPRHIGVEMEKNGKSSYLIGGYYQDNAGSRNYFVTGFDTDKLLDPTSLGDTPASAHIQLYPNPATHALNLKLSDQSEHISATVYHADGRKMAVLDGRGDQVFDTSHWSSGMYWLTGEYLGTTIHQAFVIQ